MSKGQKVAVVVAVALVLVGGIGPLVGGSLHDDVGYECSGWGGAASWYLRDAPDLRSGAKALRSQGQEESAASVEQRLVAPCDEVARRQVVTAVVNVVVVVLIATLVVWAIGRRRGRSGDQVPEPEPTDNWSGPLPPSPPQPS